MDDQIFLTAPSLLVGLLPFGPEFWLSIDARCPIPTILTALMPKLLRSRDAKSRIVGALKLGGETRASRQENDLKMPSFSNFSGGELSEKARINLIFLSSFLLDVLNKIELK
jgi:hypothetical protein